MGNNQQIHGIFAACLTPIQLDGRIDLNAIPKLFNFLASRGCHGILLFGTTGEGPSFSPQERLDVFNYAIKQRVSFPELKMLVGTGTPSLDETMKLTKTAFDLGFDGVVVLPPYYFRKISDEGLFQWFDFILQKAVPRDGALFGYHIPQVSGVPLSIDLLARLKDAHPDRFAGLKDSSGDPNHLRKLGRRFGKDLIVMNGNDRLFTQALESQASGCITAMANVISPLLRQAWDIFHRQEKNTLIQERIAAARDVMDRNQPAPPLLKYILHKLFDFPYWPVRPPLLTIDQINGQNAVDEIAEIMSSAFDHLST